MNELSDYHGIIIVFLVVSFLYFLPEIRQALRWIYNRSKESQQIGEVSRKITELQKYDDRLQKEVEREIKNELKDKNHERPKKTN